MIGATLFCMNIASLEAQLRLEGFTDVYLWHNGPGEMYPAHIDSDPTARIVVQGSIILNLHGVDREYREGERFEIPAGIEHHVRMGEQGCTYLVGEKV
jgi:quercetin dioxygenase-like cupin family protein